LLEETTESVSKIFSFPGPKILSVLKAMFEIVSPILRVELGDTFSTIVDIVS
jgi:hypothetical protein